MLWNNLLKDEFCWIVIVLGCPKSLRIKTKIESLKKFAQMFLYIIWSAALFS